MTKKEVKESNIIIACFDGWKTSGQGGNLSNFYRKGSQFINSDRFEYNLSWDWLMPVIEKIESLGYEAFIKSKACLITKESKKVVEYISEYPDNKLNITFKTIVEFIKIYNKND